MLDPRIASAGGKEEKTRIMGTASVLRLQVGVWSAERGRRERPAEAANSDADDEALRAARPPTMMT